jgi:hypothetical protein
MTSISAATPISPGSTRSGATERLAWDHKSGSHGETLPQKGSRPAIPVRLNCRRL